MLNEDTEPFTTLNAACALSRMTSPNCPVRMSLPLPGTRVASIKRMSPPTGVQASPVATPGTLVLSATSSSKIGAPNISCRSVAAIDTELLAPSAMRTAACRNTLPI